MGKITPITENMENLSFRVIYKIALIWIKNYFFISNAAFRTSIHDLLLILVGAIVIYPIVTRLPLLGWDWFFFFNANNPAFNILSNHNAYPPFAKYIIQLFTWMDWRTSLGLLNAISIMTVSIATWKNDGKYKEIILALTMPPLWFLMWVGHPDGLVLLGLVTGIVPLVLMKPILSIFGTLSNRKLFAWSVMLILLSLVIWPGWLNSLRFATIGHETAIGWADSGWFLIILGMFLILGAGSDPYRLMAAGCFLTPYLMPYHMVLIIPLIGKARGWRQIIIWIIFLECFYRYRSDGFRTSDFFHFSFDCIF